MENLTIDEQCMALAKAATVALYGTTDLPTNMPEEVKEKYREEGKRTFGNANVVLDNLLKLGYKIVKI